MSKDMLGSVVRAAIGVPQDHLDLLARIAGKFGIKNPEGRPEGRVWHAYIKHLAEKGLPDWAYLLDIKTYVVDLGEVVVNYDETTEKKLFNGGLSSSIRSEGFLVGLSGLSKSRLKSAERTGRVRYKASAVHFNVPLTRGRIEEWGRQNNKVMGGLKEGVDTVLSVPLLKLAPALPLVIFGECFYDTFEYSYTPSFRGDGDRVRIGLERFDESVLWDKAWKSLALEEIQS